MSQKRAFAPRDLPGAVLLSLCLAACSADDGGTEQRQQPPAWPMNGWQVQSPESRGMDSGVLERAREYAFQDGRNTQGVVVARGGVIVAEWYADGAGADSWAASWSVAKVSRAR